MSVLSKRTAAAFAAFSLLCIASNATAQNNEYYYVGDQRVPLPPSNNYRAFKVGVEGGVSQLRSLRRRIPSAVETEQTPVLEKYNIILAPKAGPMSMRALRESIQSAPEVQRIISEPPVYNIDGADQVLINEFLVQFESGMSSSQARGTLEAAGAQITEQSPKIEGRYKVTFPGMSEQQALAKSNELHERSTIKFSQPNFIRILPARPQIMQRDRQGAVAPTTQACPPSVDFDDTFFSCQWALRNNGTTGIAGADIKAVEAWRTTTGSPEIIVAILDEGVDIQHPDLKDKIVTPYDATDGDNNQDPHSGDAHGTACGGIVAAIGRNAQGIIGVAPMVKILPVRIATGNPLGGWVTTDEIIEDGIRTAVDRGAHVLSNSWGGGSPSNAITTGFEYALSHGRTVVIAAGNSFSVVSYPANLSASHDIIAVSATNEWDEFKTPMSKDGENWWGSNHGSQISISAPGVHVYTSDIRGNGGYSSDDYTVNFNGTSSATPHVAGAAALILSVNPALPPAVVRDILQANADELGEPGFDEFFGHGRLNIERALKAVQAVGAAGDKNPPSVARRQGPDAGQSGGTVVPSDAELVKK